VILISSVAIAVLFGSGAYLLLKHDLIRLIFGTVLIGNAANLFIMSAGLRRGDAPIYPLTDESSDPLVQAMTLTAIVISFSVSALVLGLAWRVYVSHASVDMRRLSKAEEAQAELDDRARDERADEDESHEERVAEEDEPVETTREGAMR
jgi:multicomponent Na+:H+ antiporter subunit C